MNRLRIAIVGARGRMGRRVHSLIESRYPDRLSVDVLLGRDGDMAQLADTDIAIDFSLPDGTERLVTALEALDGGPATVVSGTTGMDDPLLTRFGNLGRARKVMHATNFSTGIAAVTHILEDAAPLLAALGYTPVLTETHHRHKQDAPSGTAITMRAAMKPFDDIQTHSIRAGEIVGRHDVIFFGDHDQLSIGHDALDRGVFARGAIDAALWLSDREETAGSLTMATYFRERFLGD